MVKRTCTVPLATGAGWIPEFPDSLTKATEKNHG